MVSGFCREQLPDTGILLIFGLGVAVVIACLAWFRRHPLGTTGRVVLSLVAVGLIVIPPVVREGVRAGHLVSGVVVAVVLAAGIYTLHRRGSDPPPQ